MKARLPMVSDWSGYGARYPSTTSVVDLNGGDADPGDVLRYTITVQNSAAIPATGVVRDGA